MHIIHIASEMARIAKVGGLGDVILGLSRQCADEGHEVEVILPRYTCLHHEGMRDLHVLHRDLWSFGGGKWHHNTIWAGWVEGIKVYLIEPHTAPHYFERERIYGYDDDIERFIYFSRAALEFLQRAQIKPDILHLHEWHSALCAPLYHDLYGRLGNENGAVVFTMHNLKHQGQCSVHDLDKVGIHGADYLHPDKLQHNADPNTINLLKGGIVYADAITTVSPTYAKEVLGPKFGMDLDETLLQHQDKFQGVLNGLDYSLWGPTVDKLLPVAYSHDDESIRNKGQCKHALRDRLALEQRVCPVVGTIARLVPQKGVEMIKHSIFEVLDRGGQFVLLGSAATKEINDDFHALKIHFADNPNVHLELHHHEELAHLIYAGCDLFMVPSLFEPCGLTQIIALRYGTVPLVRRTGGLADTVFDDDNGFTFDTPNFASCDAALHRALDLYENDKKAWTEMMVRGMKMDFSWKRSSKEYLDVYAQVINRYEASSSPSTS